MVARLFFPAFASRKPSEYHRHLAGVVEFGAKIADPEFRMNATLKHWESFSELCSSDAQENWAKSVRATFAFSRAMEEGTVAFWSSWFSGIAEMHERFGKIFEAPKKSAFLVYGRSSDDHVVSVRFGNRLMSGMALEEIRALPVAANA